MAHFARLDNNNTVTMVTVVSNEDMVDTSGTEREELGIAICEQVVGPGPWVQTSYNGKIRKQYAGLGFVYDEGADVFIAPQPYPSWVLNDAYNWEPPIPMPTTGAPHEWNEETQTWDEIPTEEPTP